MSHAERMELVDRDLTVEAVPLAEIEEAPYAVRSFDPDDNSDYIEDVHEHGAVKSFPVITPVEDGYQIVDGHKRIWAAKLAGLTDQPCRVVELSVWEAAVRFAWNHFPLPDHCSDDNDRCREERYSDPDVEASLRELYRRFGEKLLDLYPVRYNVDRLELNLDEGDG